MTKEELRKSLDFVNEERERLQYDINNLTYQLAMKKAELDEANDSVTWWHNRFNAVQNELERKDNIINAIKNFVKTETAQYYLSDDEKLEKYKSRIEKAVNFINKHCVNHKVSIEVGFKVYTMMVTDELESVMKILENGRSDE